MHHRVHDIIFLQVNREEMLSQVLKKLGGYKVCLGKITYKNWVSVSICLRDAKRNGYSLHQFGIVALKITQLEGGYTEDAT
jgi:hypothetical protein